MANPSITNLTGSNTGPGYGSQVNTQSPYSTFQFVQAIAVAITPVATASATTAEQSFGLNGVSFPTLATGVKPGDVILAINPPSTTAGVSFGASRVDTAVADKFYVQVSNQTAGALTAASGTYIIVVGRPNVSNLAALPAVLVA